MQSREDALAALLIEVLGIIDDATWRDGAVDCDRDDFDDWEKRARQALEEVKNANP